MVAWRGVGRLARARVWMVFDLLLAVSIASGLVFRLKLLERMMWVFESWENSILKGFWFRTFALIPRVLAALSKIRALALSIMK